MKLLAKALLLSLFLGWWSAKPVFAANVIFEDDFSQGLGKWQAVRDGGEPWTVVNGKAEATITRPFIITELVPKAEYWDPHWQNIEYQLEYTPLQGVDKNVSFGFQDVRNWYEVHFFTAGFELARLKDGAVTLDQWGSFSLSNGRTYQIKIKFDKGNIDVFVDNVQIIDTFDWSFNDNYGKISIKVGNGNITPTKVQFDNIVVTSLDDQGQKLNVPLFKQTDPAWKDQEYDSASSWSTKASIGRWGCALSSLAMVMKYHGLELLPDGSTLTPSTLNAWLKSQPDGYLSGGALNWLAGTRLTRLISQKYGTPKLEYAWQTGSSTIAASEIANRKPVIVQIDGHFLVADGVTGDGTDLYIKDPAYTYELLSKHKTPLLSVRTFQPSFTDLSYLLLAHQPGLDVKVRQTSGQSVSFTTASDTIADPIDNSGQTTPHITQRFLPKPDTGTYMIEVSQPTLQAYSLQVITYDAAANPTLFNQTGYVGPQPLTFQLQYQKNGTSFMKPVATFTQFRKDLMILKKTSHFKQHFVYVLFDRIASYGEQASTTETKQRYINLLKVLVKAQSNYLTGDGRKYLQQQLVALEQSA